MRFIAVIPNYNGAENLPNLLRSVLKQGFNNVFVLDDASTDNSIEVIQKFADKITIVEGQQNLGPAGNRNRILKHLRQSDIICFIDADMEMLSGSFRTKVLAILKQETSIGIIGGLVFAKNGNPMTFNYGYFSNAWRDVIGGVLEHIAVYIPFLRTPLTAISSPFTHNLRIRFRSPARTDTDWVSEAFCIMRGDVFREVGGFDSRLKYHEGQRIARQFYDSGFTALFWPDIHARHLEIQTRPHNKTLIKNWFKLRQK